MNSTQHFLECKGQTLPILVRKHAKARRIILRYRPHTRTLALTLPRRASLRQGLRFIEEKRSWISRQIEAQPQKIAFTDGQDISLLGRRYRLCHVGGRGLVGIKGDTIAVPGEAAFMARRVRDWLIAHARQEITAMAQDKAQQLGRNIGKISLRDTVSHWGSCTKAGNLSFSWRLMFAPPEVLEYVVCHEVAHLAELNHGPRFWAQVAALCPHYKAAQGWLKKNGAALYRFG